MNEVYNKIELDDFLDYEISNYGNLKHHGMLKTPWNTINGYKMYCLYSKKLKTMKKVLIHRLVGIAFLPLVEGKDLINHKDGDKTNNNLSNLEWCTQKENRNHPNNKIGNYGKRYSKEIIEEVRVSKLKIREIIEKYSMSRSNIFKIRKNKNK